METDVSLVQDARPKLGKNVAIFGQGLIGLRRIGCRNREMKSSGSRVKRTLSVVYDGRSCCSELHSFHQQIPPTVTDF